MIAHSKSCVVLIILIVLSMPHSSLAQNQIIDEAKGLIALHYGVPLKLIRFKDVRLAENPKSGVTVCGEAHDRRFFIRMDSENKTPFIEEKGSASFNFGWNLVCMSKGKGTIEKEFTEDLATDICTIDSWHWRKHGVRGIKIEGESSCQNAEFIIKAYDGDRFLGYDRTTVISGVFTAYIDGRPKSNKLRIKHTYSK